jgi:uncharacterized protein (DUF1800 family)
MTGLEMSAESNKPKKKKSKAKSGKRISAAATPFVLKKSDYHLASRFSFGVNEQLVADIRRAGSARKWFNKQLKPTKVSDAAGKRVVNWHPPLKHSPAAAWHNAQTSKKSAWEYGVEFVSYSTARKIETKRQVQEVMTDFWSNLLYVPAGEDRSFPYRYQYDQTIRAHALGSFSGLLRAAVVHPAMSGWLNNNDNTKNGINENLGRELLELFTVGRVYSEDDVKNSARILTGYHVAVFKDFNATYRPETHWVGPVRVLGFTHPNASADGRATVDAYLDYLAHHPATAKRIARRLCVKFVGDNPSAAIVNAVARSYLKNNTNIAATLRTLVSHPHFGTAKRRKVRMPAEDIINTARVLGLRPTGGTSAKSFTRHLTYMSEQVGQSAYKWPRPDGFPEQSNAWMSSGRMLRSWNIHYALAGNWWKSDQLARPSRKSKMPTGSKFPLTVGQLVDHQSRVLLGRASSKTMRKNAARALGQRTTHRFRNRNEVSEWSWLLIQGAVLNSPEGVLR